MSKIYDENVKKQTQFQLTPIKKVLIALDYNTNAQEVAEQGYTLATTMNAEVVLLHVLADVTYYSSLEYSPVLGFGGFNSESFFKMVDEDGPTKAAQYFLDELKMHFNDDSIVTIVDQGDYAETILKIANEMSADVIVMGSHSRRWLEQIIIGSVTEKVLHHTSIPMYIIPTKKQDSPKK